MAMEVVSTPNEELEEESYIRDVADRPILRAALNAKADKGKGKSYKFTCDDLPFI